MGVPARYVNGLSVDRGESASDQAHHAWAEAWVDGLGWVGFDPANRLCPTERYVRLACGLDYGLGRARFAAPAAAAAKRRLTSSSTSSSKRQQ